MLILLITFAACTANQKKDDASSGGVSGVV
jgi:hypothetical protein